MSSMQLLDRQISTNLPTPVSARLRLCSYRQDLIPAESLEAVHRLDRVPVQVHLLHQLIALVVFGLDRTIRSGISNKMEGEQQTYEVVDELESGVDVADDGRGQRQLVGGRWRRRRCHAQI